MTQLMRPIEYKVNEVRDLPISWVSTEGVDVGPAGAYEVQCKKEGKTPDPQRVAELLGNNVVHLRQHTLENGLRYVTIHQANGTEVFDNHRYTLISCECGHIRDSPGVTSATSWTNQDAKRPDLGDGFKLWEVVTGKSLEQRGITRTTVDKEFVAPNGNKFRANYELIPDVESDGGYLNFGVGIKTPHMLRWRARNLARGGQFEEREYPIDVKDVRIIISSPRREAPDQPLVIGKSSVTVIHNTQARWTEDAADQVEFKFNEGKLEEVVGISQGSNPNPEWTDQKVLDAIRKGSNNWFHYKAEDREAQVLATAVFGSDINQLRHDARSTLNTLIEAVIKETDIDLATAMKFI